ncbi:MAG: aminotransferase class I/II-fold pyridoxal phosphate-dependent enzyme, partial [Candidatus Eremiobacteraeota bacterium]|nr:aminotransferase class I/II-fold pyridoxal phosphate-dependent enzyme [Candidatus Eremiobacteraeota bacterium]
MRPLPQARRAVQAMTTYSPPLEGRRAHTRLDFNENTIGFPELFPDVNATFLTTYPEYQEAIEALAESLGLSPQHILLTNGSDEGLFVGCFTFIEPNEDRALVGSPTFALIPHYLRLCQADIVEIEVKEDLKPDLDRMEELFREGVKMAVLATPENPTGQTVPLARLTTWLETYPKTVFL